MFLCLLYTRHIPGIMDDSKREQAQALYTVLLFARRDSYVQVAIKIYINDNIEYISIY